MSIYSVTFGFVPDEFSSFSGSALVGRRTLACAAEIVSTKSWGKGPLELTSYVSLVVRLRGVLDGIVTATPVM